MAIIANSVLAWDFNDLAIIIRDRLLIKHQAQKERCSEMVYIGPPDPPTGTSYLAVSASPWRLPLRCCGPEMYSQMGLFSGPYSSLSSVAPMLSSSCAALHTAVLYYSSSCIFSLCPLTPAGGTAWRAPPVLLSRLL